MPLNRLIAEALLPQLEHLFTRLLAEERTLALDGTPVFNGRDKFLPGKLAMGAAHLLQETPRSDPRFATWLAGFRRVAVLTLEDTNESWGIYYHLAALHRLQTAGWLDEALDAATLTRLRERLDWRTFVRAADYTLINLPTNYYGVAFSIARLRFLLGWEDAAASDVLLEKTIAHYRTYSGEFGFSDETEGEGRFDRYSILLIGEICQRFIETGLEVTPQLKDWLRKAVDVILVQLNPAGEGFQFGRSIGPYGDTAFLEVLSAAAQLGVLTPVEREMAYAFQVRATARYAEFWYDAATKSVNLWDGGRRTDAYRGKFRILGENMSLLHQHLYTAELWRKLGFAGRAPVPAAEYEAWLRARPRFTLTWFARGEYDRALLTFRDDLRVVALPLVNGGRSQHMHNPYFPIPFSSGLLQGAADAEFPQLLPRFTLADGTQLTAAAYLRNIRAEPRGTALVLTYEQLELDRLGGNVPVKDARLRVQTTYTLDAGVITRTDRYIPVAPLEGVNIELEFATIARDAVIEGGTVAFGSAGELSLVVRGFDTLHVADVSGRDDYRSPTGQMQTRVRATTTGAKLEAPFTLSWTLQYR